jgi:hypothetical protein
MAVFLRDVAGEPLSSFSQGSSQWASGGTNGGSPSFGQPNTLFGANITSRGVTTPTSTSITRPGPTSGLGFTDPLKSKPGAHGSPMNPVAPSTETGSSGTPTAANIKGDANPAGMAAKAGAKKLSPDNETPDDEEQEPSSPYPVLAGQAAGQAVKLGAKVLGRYGSMWLGATEARAGSEMPGGMSLGEDAEDV